MNFIEKNLFQMRTRGEGVKESSKILQTSYLEALHLRGGENISLFISGTAAWKGTKSSLCSPVLISGLIHIWKWKVPSVLRPPTIRRREIGR